MHEAEVDQHLRIVGHASSSKDALHQLVPLADLILCCAIVALLGVGRRGEHQRRSLTLHQARNRRGIGRVATA